MATHPPAPRYESISNVDEKLVYLTLLIARGSSNTLKFTIAELEELCPDLYMSDMANVLLRLAQQDHIRLETMPSGVRHITILD